MTDREQIKAASAAYRDELAALSPFDGNVWLGGPEGFPLAQELPSDGLAAVMKEYGVRGALVSHWRGKTVSPQDGNRALEVDLPDDVFCVWTGLPLWPHEDGPLPGLGTLPEAVRGVRIFPKSHHFTLARWSMGPLCEYLTERRLPLFVWHTELDWPGVYQMASEFPALAVVIESQPQKILYSTRWLFPLMRERKNVCVELSNFAGQGFVEYAVKEFGASRLIYGSFLPMNDPYVPLGVILEARIPEAQKKMIAGDNLRRLIGEVRT